MTSQPTTSDPRVTDSELAGLRQNLNLIHSQFRGGKIDADFTYRQVEALIDLLGRLETDRKEQKAGGRFQALYNVSRLLGASLDLQTVLDQVMDAIIALTAAERGFLMLRDDDGGLQVVAARNLDQQTLSSEQFMYSRTVVNKVVDSGTPILTNNAAADPSFNQAKSIIGQALRSIMATPLRARGAVIGVAYVDNRMLTGLFTEDDLTAMDTFAGQAAVAIDNARLFSATDQALAERVEVLQILRRVDRQLNETLDASKAIELTLEWACRLSAADCGVFGLVEGDPPVVRGISQHGAVRAELAHLEAAYPAAPEVVRAGRTLVQNDEAEDQASHVIVPVLRENQVFGLVIIERFTGSGFTPEQIDLIERMVNRAAVTIENARLYAAVQAADRAKSEFVGIVAHDLKVPMTSIRGYADLTLMMGNVGERQIEFLHKVKDTVDRMAILVSDLADISRIESGHFYMDARRVPVAEITRGVADAILTQMHEYQHHYQEEVAAELPDLHVDYYRLLQVLTNLLSNAAKYTPPGGRITFRAVSGDDGRVVFSISDTGIGLSPEAVAKLQEGAKFWRAEDDFTRSRPGTGLGFAITRSLVEQMGSRIVIDSQPGQGSTFTFAVAVVPA